jgi:hypothetical protein
MKELYAKEYAEFITVTCLDWKLVLSDARFKDIIVDSLNYPLALVGVRFTNKQTEVLITLHLQSAGKAVTIKIIDARGIEGLKIIRL